MAKRCAIDYVDAAQETCNFECDSFYAQLADEERFVKSCKLICVLKRYFEENNYAGMAVACWTRFQERLDIFPCMAYGYLCDHGYPVACEGDLLGLISMIMLSGATQKRAALMDMVPAVRFRVLLSA